MRRSRRAGFSRSSAGFTLVELTVALVAGLIVAMGIVALSRSATATFNEEMRNSTAEAALRGAVDRLRVDLQRAGFMSTGNIMTDHAVALPPGAVNKVWNIKSDMAGIRRLAALYLDDGGSITKNTLAQEGAQPTPLLPDLIEIAGNMTTSEQFDVALIQPAGSSTNGACQRILLSPTSAAMYRLNAVGAVAAADELRNIFQPVPANMTTQFIVRVVDDAGRAQYVATCKEYPTAGFTTVGASPQPYPYVDIDAASTPLQTASGTGTVSTLSGYGAGRASINPVQIVRWEITGPGGTDAEPIHYTNALGNLPLGGADANKYDLIRSFVDATGQLVPETTEVIAEYAVDFDVAFTVDNGTNLRPTLVTYAFDDTGSNAWAYDVSQAAASQIGPQRIRSVRARLVTRTAQPDRTANVKATNSTTAGEFLYRYCVAPDCTKVDNTLRWARARTITTEVTLPNLARNWD
jgi:hypothetical protein